ncbi:hypothetical protein [Rhodococcus jostii]|uniref:hypothetical protein n=1 Tax=Rhodococcus jostii TaxID=132919 RepID=UPI0036252A14
MTAATIVNIYGQDDSFWPVYGGADAGSAGVYLGQDQVKGLFDTPTRTFWAQGAHQSGGTMKAQWDEIRDISLGFHVLTGSSGRATEDILSRFRRAFDYREDPWDHDARLARIEVITDRSGTRCLDVQLYEAPDFNPGTDPIKAGYGNPILPLRAGQPNWYQDDVITSWSTTATSGSGTITVSNPTDQPMKQKWIITRGDWTLPDVSWEGAPGVRVPGVDKLRGRDDRDRMILMPTLGAIQGGATVDLDTDKELMVRDAHDTNLLGQMPVPGRYFLYVIPPYTPDTELPVSVTGARGGGVGAMVQLVQPRRWSSCMGLEL